MHWRYAQQRTDDASDPSVGDTTDYAPQSAHPDGCEGNPASAWSTESAEGSSRRAPDVGQVCQLGLYVLAFVGRPAARQKALATA